jgi:uncharacterized RDD family membrane protein YckC
MEQTHNPYSPPRAPLIAEQGPRSAANIDFEETDSYGSFWRRFGAQLLDGLIVMPLTLLIFAGMNYTKMFYVYWFVPGMLFSAFFDIYLVRRFGGTPGKRILGMRIAMLDGSRVTVLAAFLRYSVMYALSLLSALAMVAASFKLSDASYSSANYIQKMLALQAAAPRWNVWVTGAIYAWFLCLAIVMLCNRKRRSVHDFIAGTVVLREH